MVYRSISNDVKEIALTMVARGLSLDEIAELLLVSKRSVYRWKRNFDVFESVQRPPERPRGRPRLILPAVLDALHVLIQNEPSAYLVEMQTWIFLEHAIHVSLSTIQRELTWLGLSHKKLSTLAKERNENKRLDWVEFVQANFTASQIVCTDESYKDARTHARSYGRAMRNHEAFELVAFVRGERYSILPALSADGVIAVEVIQGPVNGEIFINFIANEVIPHMNPFPGPNSVLLLDNCAIHYVFELEELLNASGCVLLPLPAYSPDFNPIEKMFHQVKHGLRSRWMGAVEGDEGLTAIAQELAQVTPANAAGYYKDCGFSMDC